MQKSFERIFNTGWTNFRRNSYLSFGTTGVMILVLMLFSLLIGLNFISNQVVATLGAKVDVTAYFKSEALEEEILDVKGDLERLGEVNNVAYISRDEALDEFKENHAGDILIQDSLAVLEENPLQASLNISAIDSYQYASIVEFLEASKFRTLIDKIDYYENEQVIARIRGITNGIQSWGFILTIVLAFVAVLVTFNTIRLTIYSQKQEIEIMRLVGGSNWHIKAPFLIEGGLYGFFAALITLAIFYPSVYIVSPKVDALMPGLGLIGYYTSNILQFALLITFVGVLLGVVSSFVAIRRFLKV